MRDLSEIVRSSDAVELIRHELNAPVATALLYVSIAENYASRLPVDVITPALRVVRSEIQRLKSLIDTMTEMQRSGRPSLRPQLIDIGGTVRATVKRLLTTFSGHGECRDHPAAARRARLVGSDRRGADRQQPALQRAEVRSRTFDSPGGEGDDRRREHLGPRSGCRDRRRRSDAHLRTPRARARRGRGRQRPRPLVGARADARSRRPRDGAQPQGPRHHVHGRAADAAAPARRREAASSRACRRSAARCGPSRRRRRRGAIPAYWQDRLARSQVLSRAATST